MPEIGEIKRSVKMSLYDMFGESITPEDLPFAFPIFTRCGCAVTFVECKQCGNRLFANYGRQVCCLRCHSPKGKLLWELRTRTTVPVA
ncbi:hypothetical protein ES703_120990 [subsurface metagenome]